MEIRKGLGFSVTFPWTAERVSCAPKLAVVNWQDQHGHIGKELWNTCWVTHVATMSNRVKLPDLTDRLRTSRAKIFDIFCPLAPVIAMGLDGN